MHGKAEARRITVDNAYPRAGLLKKLDRPLATDAIAIGRQLAARRAIEIIPVQHAHDGQSGRDHHKRSVKAGFTSNA